MKVKLNYMYTLKISRFGRNQYSIISASVDNGENGYNCWGYELSVEGVEGNGVVFKPNWTTPGDAVNAAIEDFNTPGLVVNG